MQPVEVVGSPIDGYRMRARLHVRDGRIGFFREGTHSLCDAAATRQLRADTDRRRSRGSKSLAGARRRDCRRRIEISENIDATERAHHLELLPERGPVAARGR